MNSKNDKNRENEKNKKMPMNKIAGDEDRDNDSVVKIYSEKNKFNNLVVDTITLIRNAAVSYTVICEECGVSRGWISQVISGVITDPGAHKIERVHDFLKSHQR